MHVRRYEILSAPSTVSAAALQRPSGTKQETYAFVLVDLGQGVDITTAQAQDGVFGTTSTGSPSFKQYFEQDSYGAIQVTGDVVGPLSYPLSQANWSSCAVGDDTAGISQMTAALKPRIGKTYDHYMFYMGPGSGCDFGGIGEEGSASQPAVNAWYADVLACGPTEHEVGHNHGMFHENSLTCPNGAVLADAPMGTCTSYEYGFGGPPTISIMGQACGHTDAWDTWYAQWFTGCNAVRVRSSGTFTLVPIEAASSGTQALQIPMPKPRPFQSDQAGPGQLVQLAYYYLELRAPVGMDGWVAQPTVFVHVGEDIHPPQQSGNWTWILDMDPSTGSVTDGLGLGKTFTDPAGGVSMTLKSVGANSATVEVVLANGTGASTCLDGNPVESDAGAPDAGGAGGPDSGTGAPDSGSGGVGPLDAAAVDATSSEDAGNPGRNGGSPGADAAGPGMGDSTGTDGSGGCGCGAAGRRAPATSAAMVAALGLLTLGRRRRARSRGRRAREHLSA
jgi:uncharacterized protein (TIGR03382 family)